MLPTTRSNRLCSRFNATLTARFWQHFFDPASLTVKLKHAGELRVEVCQQGVCLADRTMLEPLSLRKQHYLWRRQVLLSVDNSVWIEAQTLLPLLSLSPTARRLLLLNDRPLGEWLFRDPNLRRSDFSRQWQHANPVRQSRFDYYHSPLYLQEIFHPPAVAYFSRG